ncbi:MAG: hypothetical protein JOZ12_12520 [Sinobacteraceae bacterium]|nr:hypothetical protein [Nevskiaceae bacterium]MBV9911827.1 hypothetical protein [Nevskiaceae bacterium]
MLSACSVGHFDANAPQEVDLSGNWVLDRAASDNPQPILERLRPRPSRYPGGMEGAADDNSGPTRGSEGGTGGRGRGRGAAQVTEPDLRSNDIYRRVPVIQMLRADVARADHITIRQSPGRFTLDYGVSVRNFTPGQVSVVSAEWGVADQSSGWKGRSYIIKVKPQSGVASEEVYSLSSDGKHLTEELRLGGSGYESAKLHRVYERTDQALPRAAPSND